MMAHLQQPSVPQWKLQREEFHPHFAGSAPVLMALEFIHIMSSSSLEGSCFHNVWQHDHSIHLPPVHYVISRLFCKSEALLARACTA